MMNRRASHPCWSSVAWKLSTIGRQSAIMFASDGRPPLHLHEEAREVGWSDEQLIEAVAQVALNEFQSLIANAAALPQDQSDPAMLPSAA